MRRLSSMILATCCLLSFNTWIIANPPNTILFQITHPDSDKVSYLFGTHHAFGKSFFDSLQAAKIALHSCDLLIKENLNIPGQTATDIVNARPTTTKWSKYLDKAEIELVQGIFAPGQLDFHKLTPAELFTFLNRHYKERICLRKNPEELYISLDDYIGQLAAAQQMELLGLETTAEQIRLINQDIEGMPRKVHQKRLAGILTKIQSNQANDCGETDWYRQMDFDLQLKQPCQNSLMLTDRNNKWMAQLKDYLPTQACFIAVGLSHLMFECGLLRQLEEQGYVVTAVPLR